MPQGRSILKRRGMQVYRIGFYCQIEMRIHIDNDSMTSNVCTIMFNSM